jgi:hypothetical protein
VSPEFLASTQIGWLFSLCWRGWGDVGWGAVKAPNVIFHLISYFQHIFYL